MLGTSRGGTRICQTRRLGPPTGNNIMSNRAQFFVKSSLAGIKLFFDRGPTLPNGRVKAPSSATPWHNEGKLIVSEKGSYH